jgi:hypothetical protein
MCCAVVWRDLMCCVIRGRPWGAYVTTADMQDSSIDPEELWASGSKSTSESGSGSASESGASKERAISLVLYRSYFTELGAECLRQDQARIHGVAVWCLSSGLSNEVQYHVDYAELYRYETHIIHPPLYAGTCHISPLQGKDMTGGDFYANMSGLDHYKQYGYKSLLKPQADLMKDIESSGDWVRVRYKRNRAILHDGDFPHFSSPISQLAPDKKRVILGFNFFSDALGECCVRAPEVSERVNHIIGNSRLVLWWLLAMYFLRCLSLISCIILQPYMYSACSIQTHSTELSSCTRS